MVTYLTRADWGARPSRGAVALDAAEVEGDALHWPGMARPINAVGEAGKARIASALRGWQNYHMDVRGWSDIAYQIAVDQEGRAWTLRGLNIRSGANGNGDVNRRFGAILLIVAPGEQPSAKMKETVKQVLRDFRKRFPKCARRPKGHKDVRPAGTDCPGPLSYAAIQRGEFDAALGEVILPHDPADKRPRNSKGQLSMSYKALMYALDNEVSATYQAYVDSAMLTLRHLGYDKNSGASSPWGRSAFRATWYTFVEAVHASANRYAFEYLVDRAGFWPPDNNDWPENARDR